MRNKIRKLADNNSEKALNNKHEKVLEIVKDLLEVLIFGILISFTIMHFVRVSRVIGHSMDNTLQDGQRLIVDMRAYKKQVPHRGDIVVAYRGDLSIQYFIKRVIAVPGDTIEIKNGIVYLNDEELKEDYIKEPIYDTESMEKTTIADNEVFVMGDNRNNSMDSRNPIIGKVSIDKELVGKIIFDINHLKRMGVGN